MIARRTLLMAVPAALGLAGPVAAQGYPTRVIRMITPFTPGSPVDVAARLLAQHLGTHLGQSVVVDNRPGAGTTIGMKAAAAAEPDGYTLLMAASTLAINPAMYRKVSYDALKDFAPITQVAGLPNVVLVHP